MWELIPTPLSLQSGYSIDPRRLGDRILADSFTSYVFLGNSFKHCEPQASHLKKMGGREALYKLFPEVLPSLKLMVL